MPRKARRRSDAGPAHPGTPRPPVRGEASPGWVAAGQDRLQEAILDLVAEHTARDRGVAGHGVSDQAAKRSPVGLAGALWRISTTPVEPLTRIRSPVLIVWVATEVPTTAGMPNSRESTAGGETGPPASATSPATLGARGGGGGGGGGRRAPARGDAVGGVVVGAGGGGGCCGGARFLAFQPRPH